ncbi:response regulator [Rathayibacter sp. VKM Ac-2759]|uniref:response regulator transcription factor n=1 Tax=Rathayibacter sp. VKM Ac-2759 TaxID=2609252 RepID=UPI0013195AAF|nr:response regulator transcription factor [Rathayibacter sp. VKM Ac-2759]QHC67819.1 response regulator [Rathayibacter sp. VKM Ac-2759]
MRIALVDDDPRVRRALGDLLRRSDAVDELSEHGDVLSLLDLMRERAVDTVLLDIRLQHSNALAAVPAIRRAGPRTRIVAMTAVADAPFAAHARNAGADAVIAKTAPSADVLDIAVGNPPRTGLPWDTLTPREHGIAELVVAGFSDAEIAVRLGVPAMAARARVAAVLARLGLDVRAQLASAGRGSA